MADKRISLRKARGGPKIEPPPRDLKKEALAEVKEVRDGVVRYVNTNFPRGANVTATLDPTFDPNAIAAAIAATAAVPSAHADTMERVLQQRREGAMRQRTAAISPAQSSVVNVPARALLEMERRNRALPDRERPATVIVEQDMRTRSYNFAVRLNPNFLQAINYPEEAIPDYWNFDQHTDSVRARLANEIADRLTRELVDSVRQDIFEMLRDRVRPGRRF